MLFSFFEIIVAFAESFRGELQKKVLLSNSTGSRIKKNSQTVKSYLTKNLEQNSSPHWRPCFLVPGFLCFQSSSIHCTQFCSM